MIFGENLLALLVLALGGALAAGNLLALVRPREPLAEDADEDEVLERAPLGRSLAMIALGLIAAIWALASLASGGDDDPGDGAAADASTAGIVLVAADHT